ncbi:MAG: ABC transporter permease, partial [Candidatus Polarisedimenticolia bacterium]
LLLVLARLRELMREPEVVFWIFIFPILLAVGLGMAFRNKPPDEIAVAIVDGPGAAATAATLPASGGFATTILDEAEAARRLRLGKVAIVVVPGASYEYRFDPTRPDGALARQRVHDALQRGAGRTDPVGVRETPISEPGARYIDFLIPGLLGMNIMSGGMWGVGFAIVDMRSRKLLKRLIATPMRRSDFLGSIMTSRVLLVLMELALMLFFGWLVFDMVIRGSLWSIVLLALLGAFVFSGIGLLVACRTARIETASGLMNLVMLPMFVFSGIFFSADRFPAVIQPFVKALPLTALNDALRASILEGADLPSQAARIGVLLGWGIASFVVGLRVFRWN